jgi:hypothetical protein
MKNEQKYPWLYDSVVHQVLWTVLWSFFLITRMCYCWHNLDTVRLLFYYWTSKLINVLLSPSFSNSHHLHANFPNYKGPDPRYKWVEKSLTCTKQVGFKELVISKSFSSLLIGCVRRPTPRTDKGSSSITDNMITFKGIQSLRLIFFYIESCQYSMFYTNCSWNFS